MSLPVLIDAVTAAAMAANEERLCDLAESIAHFGAVGCHAADLAAEHRQAVILCNELLWAHESDSPADADLKHAASQLKLWHLLQIDTLLSPL